MSVEDLLIHFRYGPEEEDDRLQRQYYIPGEELKGVVTLQTSGPLRVSGISIHFMGVANVSWEATHKRKTYYDTEVHLDAGKPLLDIGYDNKITLPSGVHRFGFSYLLPSNLPSTFNGVYGSMTYVAKATIDCEDEIHTTVTSEPFMVLRRNVLPIEMYQPLTMKKSRFLFGLKSGKVHVECTIDKSAAIPGDYITIDADVMNFSGRWISLIQAAVLQESYYYAQGKEIIFRQYLNTHDDVFDTGFRTGRRWHEIKLLVPPYLADSGLETCKIMRVKYFFQFKVQLEKKEDIMVETPLYIGHHPDEMVEDGKDLLLGRMWQGITSLPQESPRQEFPWLDPTEQQQQLQAQAQDFPLDNYYR